MVRTVKNFLRSVMRGERLDRLAPSVKHRQHIRIAATVLGGITLGLLPMLAWSGCAGGSKARALARSAYQRSGDEIMVAGQLFHTGAPVVLWTDPGGYDGYRVEKRFTPFADSGWEALVKAGKAPDSPNRYNIRSAKLTTDELERVRGGGWDLQLLQRVVDQFVIHYDVCGTSRQCFKVLHDMRGLSVHFMLDIDGTIYQTLDLKERAWHATTSNDRSVGIEIANIGSYEVGAKDPFAEWYQLDAAGKAQRITLPSRLGDGGVRTPGFIGVPMRPELVTGPIQGTQQRMYDLTPQQYDSLIKLTATLCTVLPEIKCAYPVDSAGKPLTDKLPDDQLAAYQGLLGHYHIQKNKVDPGPAFQWEYVIGEARKRVRR